MLGSNSSMAPVACPKCSVVVYETTSGGWRFDPPTGCVDLEGTDGARRDSFNGALLRLLCRMKSFGADNRIEIT
jgi:hypothetical protein